MAFRVEITENAERDAHNILDWLISQQAGDAGLRWFQGLEKAVCLPGDIQGESETVYILHIWHGRRKPISTQ